MKGDVTAQQILTLFRVPVPLGIAIELYIHEREERRARERAEIAERIDEMARTLGLASPLEGGR